MKDNLARRCYFISLLILKFNWAKSLQAVIFFFAKYSNKICSLNWRKMKELSVSVFLSRIVFLSLVVWILHDFNLHLSLHEIATFSAGKVLVLVLDLDFDFKRGGGAYSPDIHTKLCCHYAHAQRCLGHSLCNQLKHFMWITWWVDVINFRYKPKCVPNGKRKTQQVSRPERERERVLFGLLCTG